MLSVWKLQCRVAVNGNARSCNALTMLTFKSGTKAMLNKKKLAHFQSVSNDEEVNIVGFLST